LVPLLHEGGTEIKWGEKRALFEGLISNTAVAINDEFAVAVGRGYFRIACRVGRFPDREACSIEWFNEISLDDGVGICPKICLDDAGCTIMVWNSRFLKQLRPLQYDSLFPLSSESLKHAGGRFIIHFSLSL
jgi:hypothetical protein